MIGKEHADASVNTRQRVVDFVLAFALSNAGVPPTLREIVEGCRLSSTSIARYHLRAALSNRELILAAAAAPGGTSARAYQHPVIAAHVGELAERVKRETRKAVR
jgi:SOS-response transcriptional repressor LexA